MKQKQKRDRSRVKNFPKIALNCAFNFNLLLSLGELDYHIRRLVNVGWDLNRIKAHQEIEKLLNLMCVLRFPDLS